MMKRLIAALIFLFPALAFGQLWSGILSPTYGAGACTLAPSLAAASCAIDWSGIGIPGGIPNYTTQSGSTITSTGSDQTSAINSALSTCSGTSKYVLLAAGTFTVNTSLSVPSTCVLRGSGANQTIISVHGSSEGAINLGTGDVAYSGVTITSGATAGSTSLTLSSVTGISTGKYLIVSETNASWVTIHGGEGDCTWCDGWSTNGNRARGQIVEVKGVAGSVVTIDPALYSDYTLSPTVVVYTAAAKYAGLEDLQIYENNTGYQTAIAMKECAYCWIKGVEVNYADGDFVEDSWGYRDEIVNSYFSNAYVHGPGDTDSDVFIEFKTSASLVQNNIVERSHAAIMLARGAAGNVISYNYSEGEFDSGGPTSVIGGVNMHGAHPQFNLFEGNVLTYYYPDQIWGSSSHNTNHRNWLLGTTKVCTPTNDTRGTVNCTGGNGNYSYGLSVGEDIAHLSVYDNFVDDIVGSSQQQGVLSTHVGTVVWNGTANRDGYSTITWNFAFGFGEAGDDGTGTGCGGGTAPCHSAAPYQTADLYNAYTFSNTTTNCLLGGSSSTCSTSDPASFYLSSKPSWWAPAVAYPAIGTDVTGGNGPGGHLVINAGNPAQYCYLVTLGGVEGGAGSPLTTFNENTCYASSSPTPATPTLMISPF